MALYYNTVTPLLVNTLHILMEESLFDPFVLVGGTNLSLRLGHRMSDDIDLFTDVDYGSLDYEKLEHYLTGRFPYYDKPDKSGIVGFGQSYYIGVDSKECIKLDLMYADAKFFEESEILDGIRMASKNQIAAMKIEAISNGGRKKDWWDIHELLEQESLESLLNYHQTWEPWTHNREDILRRLIDFDDADKQPDPRCLKEKDWDFIKMDIIKEVERVMSNQSTGPR